MIIIDKVKYESYYDLCKAYNIDFAEFIKFRMVNKNINELELLDHFLPHVWYSMKTGEYIIVKN